MQKIITMIIAALIIYMMIDYKRKSNESVGSPKAGISQEEKKSPIVKAEEKPVEVEGNFLEKSMSQVLINLLKNDTARVFLENMIKPMDSSVTSSDFSFKINNYQLIQELLKIRDLNEGNGSPASCGHIVTANFQITNLNNVIIDSGTKTFRLGKNEIIPALDNVIVGMKPGGMREALVSAKYAYASPNYGGKEPSVPSEYYKINVTLTHIIPPLFPDNTVKIFDDEIAYRDPLMCGDHALFDVKVMKLDGGAIFDSKNTGRIEMFLGDMRYPMMFSHGLFNKTPVGTRTVICKGKYLRSMANKNSSKIFPKEQPAEENFYVIEFSNFGK